MKNVVRVNRLNVDNSKAIQIITIQFLRMCNFRFNNVLNEDFNNLTLQLLQNPMIVGHEKGKFTVLFTEEDDFVREDDTIVKKIEPYFLIIIRVSDYFRYLSNHLYI